MVANHWFHQIERVLEAMESTSSTTRIRLAAFQLAGESLIWWDWVKTSKNVEAMTLVDFRELFMSKFFSTSTRHVKAREFLDLWQGDMTVLEYVARLTELARFADDYMATNLAKVRIFEDGLRLSIGGKIIGLLMQDMDSMVRTTMAIEGEIVYAKSIRDADTGKRKEGQPFQVWESGTGLLFPKDHKDKVEAIRAKVRVGAIKAKARVGTRAR